MMENKQEITTIDGYIESLPPELGRRLQELRETIRAAAPDASEKISYAMPTFYLNGNLVHFAAFKQHIGFYPGPEGIDAFKNRFEEGGLHYSKGAVQFPLDAALPLALVSEIVLFRAEQNREKKRKK